MDSELLPIFSVVQRPTYLTTNSTDKEQTVRGNTQLHQLLFSRDKKNCRKEMYVFLYQYKFDEVNGLDLSLTALHAAE